ncbi:hypothetical protein ACFQ48_14255 [Hymenobacter caeli]|uniref:Uncharacterized protein n=1 Tax=Hymenobacter caeli TaxID=2735894 RepID=A0ABX2FSB6_9BACT|nr:hypothetical protein [Hymenobacter caeli]NRT20082.1 hypothetical protein [Hymenobacter caeli]
MPSVATAAPAAPAGAALAPGVALAQAQRVYAAAKEHCWQLRAARAPKPERRAAKQARAAARAVFAAAARAYWASPEGQRRARILDAAYHRYHAC